jgi:hypothetical protein
MNAFASGKHAHGFCDRCGFRYKLSELRAESVNRVNVGNSICPTCYDVDHEQYSLQHMDFHDPQALRNPAGDNALEASRKFFGWNPVGNQATLIKASAGKVTVSNG